MSPVLPFDILYRIIDVVGENKDTNLLEELSLVSHSFLQICSKHLFATIEIYDASPNNHIAFSKKGFVKILKSRPDVVRFIRNLTYKKCSNPGLPWPFFSSFEDNHLVLPILPNILRTISRLNCLTITASDLLDWNRLDSSLTSAFLHLMHLPTINHIDLSYISNFPLSSLSSSVNLHRLDISQCDDRVDEERPPEFGAQSEMMPKIREFHTSDSESPLLQNAEMQDGHNFMHLRRLSMPLVRSEDEQKIRYLLQNAKVLETLYLLVGIGRSLVGLLSLGAGTLKVLNLSVPLHSFGSVRRPLGGFCEELEAMAGHNMLETLSCEVRVLRGLSDAKDFIGSTIRNMEKVLVKPGWSALRQVSFHVSFRENYPLGSEDLATLCGKLRSLPDEYLSHLPNLKSVAFNYSVQVY